MSSFNLNTHLDEIYASFPEGKRKPIIGITANFWNGEATMAKAYYQQVADAGGTPVLIPPVNDKDIIVSTLSGIDGLLLSGGADINPLWSGEEPLPQLHHINASRDLPELLITQLAYNRQIPILGICRGIQTLVTALGGKVTQDIDTAMQEAAAEEAADKKKSKRAAQEPEARPIRIKHSQDGDRNLPTHSVNVEKDSMLYRLYKSEKLYVNSFHHQAVANPGKRFKVTAKSPDGVIEAVESSEYKPILGVQWHPECMETEGLRLFEWLVAQANNFHLAKRLHDRILTLDTHCDTPMFFHQDIKFDQRDPRILVDLHKMTDGRQDAVIMAAYLPQPKMGESFSSKVHFDVSTPMEYADFIFDKIEAIVRSNRKYISIARTPADLFEDKRKGRKSILFGIENGIALNHDTANVKHFAQRGVVYITLCHNGDNDICDSAKGCDTNHGVSKFGEKVIREMNHEGIMVDLSHASEQSFFDALEISKTPIVCSHSCCKALCDVPRNLSDDQLRALAQKGGVAHITLYGGFLRKEGEATIRDAIDHLNHAVRIMGIDHVGLGTDFDGDGGVRGLADSSELINFTLALLKNKYNERDIQKIWGGNWLRVMAQVQALAK
ncbi:MAG: gamma-glutamyl-gamma-aminobutyrate hydrolase family protein [Prevotella sp.]|nr:gamma-glutamyl-gamma-aminobutyrate hydrolase family protein [Prevotella sp.]